MSDKREQVIRQSIAYAWHSTMMGPKWEGRLDDNLVAEFVKIDLAPDLVEKLTEIRDTARTGLPAMGMTEEQWAKHRLNVIASRLTRMIESLETE